MKYICLVYQEDSAPLLNVSDQKMADIVAEVGAWMQDLIDAGRHVYSTGLQSAKTASTLRNRDGEISMTDGPFAETKELLGGFTILEARDMNEAIQSASKLAAICRGTVEVRPVLEPGAEVSEPHDLKMIRAFRILAERQGVTEQP